MTFFNTDKQKCQMNVSSLFTPTSKKKKETSYSAYHIGNKVNIVKEKRLQKKKSNNLRKKHDKIKKNFDEIFLSNHVMIAKHRDRIIFFE